MVTMHRLSWGIEWHARALDDLRAVVNYIALHDPARARRFGQELRVKTCPLKRHPHLGRAGRPGLPEGVRELILHPNYIAFYRLVEERGIVQILRVKHVAQRMP